MFQVSVTETFSSGHALRGYKGKCENVHGHNYRVQIKLAGPQLDNIGLLVMGGYSHSRLRETVFGGFTRRVLKAAELPVLIAH